jgi:GNAT superfamily N-acetyltransferase
MSKVSPPDDSSGTPPQCSIRPANLADAERLAELSNQLSYVSTPAEIAARLPALQQSDEHAVFIAETTAGGVVGFVHVQVRCAVEHDPRAEVASLVVDESLRSQGIGARLMQAAESWAIGRDMTTIVLRSNVTRERAHAFYERLGYKHTKSQKFLLKALT